MKKICDLHTHTLFSDGTFTPTELVNHAVELGLSAVALCDHNTVDGISEFFEAAKNQPIEVVAGTEFSVEYEGGELHLLGLFLPPECYPQITAIMKEMDKIKKESNIARNCFAISMDNWNRQKKVKYIQRILELNDMRTYLKWN